MTRSVRTVPRGQASVETMLLTFLIALLLALGPDSPLEQLFDAIASMHAGFTEAISRP